MFNNIERTSKYIIAFVVSVFPACNIIYIYIVFLGIRWIYWRNNIML